MATNRRALNQFLGRHAGKPALVAEAVDYLELLFRVAEKGRYTLSPIEAVDLKKVAADVAAATGGRIDLVQPVSLSRPFARPEGMSLNEYGVELQPRIWETLGAALGPKLGQLIEPQFDELCPSLGPGLWQGLWDGLDTALWFELWNHLRRELSIGIGDSLNIGLDGAFHNTLMAFLGHALAGDERNMRRFRDLVMLLPRAIPLGGRKNAPATWLTLVA